MLKHEAIELARSIEQKVVPSGSPSLTRQELESHRALVVPRGRHVYRRVGDNPENPNSAVEQFTYVGDLYDDDKRGLLSLLGHIVSEPLFDVLRAKEQLGYIVSFFFSFFRTRRRREISHFLPFHDHSGIVWTEEIDRVHGTARNRPVGTRLRPRRVEDRRVLATVLDHVARHDGIGFRKVQGGGPTEETRRPQEPVAREFAPLDQHSLGMVRFRTKVARRRQRFEIHETGPRRLLRTTLFVVVVFGGNEEVVSSPRVAEVDGRTSLERVGTVETGTRVVRHRRGRRGQARRRTRQVCPIEADVATSGRGDRTTLVEARGNREPRGVDGTSTEIDRSIEEDDEDGERGG